MKTVQDLTPDEHGDLQDAIAAAIAAKEGYDFATMREHGQEPTVGPHRGSYRKATRWIMDMLDEGDLSLAEIAAICERLEVEA
jgi:hypothetical protein